MRDEINDDNIYEEGSFIYAKANPELMLVIMKYKQRIYYCAAVDHSEQNNFAYFERELIPPIEQDQPLSFRLVDESIYDNGKYILKKVKKNLAHHL